MVSFVSLSITYSAPLIGAGEQYVLVTQLGSIGGTFPFYEVTVNNCLDVQAEI